MAKKIIKFSLSANSIDKALKDLQEYKKWVQQKTQELAERLADLGLYEASVRFAQAQYDGDNDVEVYTEPTAKGWKIVAQGRSVFFIEFGAGVHYNGSESYPNPRPSGIVGIGEYGQGKGKQDLWGFYDAAGDLVLTRGNPAEMPMYHAQKIMEENIRRIAKEVFG